MIAMEPDRDASEICKFYKDKHILVTGATGLLGKLVIEKLLRVCRPAMVYLIIRAKKSMDPHHRLKQLTETRLFHRLRKEDPNFMERLKIMSGDVSEPGLGLSPADVEHLVDKVQVVFHGAATVRFDEPLAIATKINVGGTKAILELCKKMKNLESVVHISTAYSHCPRKEIREEFYDTPISSEGLIALADKLSPEMMNKMKPCIIGEWNNTYVFTKAVAEDSVRKNGLGLPLSIMRPGIILTTRSEPIPNWVDHIYGPIGITAGCYVGAIRVVKFSQDDKGELMPADMTVNCLLAVGYETAKLRNLEDIPIYNFTSHPDNSVRWNNLYLYLKARAAEIPYSKACWHYTSVINVKSNFHYYFLTLLLHVLPAVLMDFGLLFLHKKPRVLHLYNKIHNGMDLVGYFSMNSWKFSMDNTINLWKNLNDEDKKLFDFDMESLDYESFLKGTVDGIKTYLVKDEDEDVVSTKRRYFVVYLIDRLFRILLLSGLLWCIWRILTDIRDY